MTFVTKTEPEYSDIESPYIPGLCLAQRPVWGRWTIYVSRDAKAMLLTMLIHSLRLIVDEA